MEGIHHLGRIWEYLVHSAGVAGEAVHRRHLHRLPNSGVAFLHSRAQDLCTTPRADAQQAGRTTTIHPEDAYPIQVVWIVVDKTAASTECTLVDQVPANAQCFNGGSDTHPVDRETLKGPAGYAVSELGTVISAAQECLEDLPRAGGGVQEPAQGVIPLQQMVSATRLKVRLQDAGPWCVQMVV